MSVGRLEVVPQTPRHLLRSCQRWKGPFPAGAAHDDAKVPIMPLGRKPSRLQILW